MEEMDVPIDAVEEEIHHHVRHSLEAHSAHESQELRDSHESAAARETWISQVALSSALFAVLAAIAALMSNHHANEAMIEQIQASDNWGYYQAKGIKANLLATKLELLSSFRKPQSEKDQERVSRYKKEQDEIAAKAKEKEELSRAHLEHHTVLARGVTMFQIAIAIAAISVLMRRRRFWYVSLGFAAIGLAFLVQGIFLLN